MRENDGEGTREGEREAKGCEVTGQVSQAQGLNIGGYLLYEINVSEGD